MTIKKYLAFLALVASLLFPIILFSQSQIGLSSVSNPIANESQKKSFIRSSGEVWAFWNNGTNIVGSQKIDSTSWDNVFSLPIITSDFSVEYYDISGVEGFVLTVTNGSSIEVYKGSFASNSFGSPVVAFLGNASLLSYANSDIAISPDGTVAITAIKTRLNVDGELAKSVMVDFASNLLLEETLNFGQSQNISQVSPWAKEVESLSIIDTANDKFLLVANGLNGKLASFFYNGNDWVVPKSNEEKLAAFSIPTNTLNGQAYVVVVKDANNVIVGGDFQNAGGIEEADNIAIWNVAESKWNALGSGLNRTVRTIRPDLSDSDMMYIGGDFTANTENGGSNYVTKWNGSSFSSLGNGVNAPVYTFNFYNGSLYAGGEFTSPASKIARWEGGSWHDLGQGTIDGKVLNLYSFSGSQYLYVGGSFSGINGIPSSAKIAKYELFNSDNFWSSLSSSEIQGGDVHTISGGSVSLYIGGDFTSVSGDTSKKNLVLYNSSGQSYSSFGNPDGPVYSIWNKSDGSLYVAGGFKTIDSGAVSAKSLALYDTDSLWKYPFPVSVEIPGTVFSLFNDYFGGGTGYPYVVGGRGDSNYIDKRGAGFLVSVNGQVDDSPLNGVVNATIKFQDKFIIAGDFTNAGGHPDADYIAIWDNYNFYPLVNSIVSSPVFSLSEFNSNLVIGGEQGKVFSWDGSNQWNVLGSNLSGRVLALEEFAGELFAGGEITLTNVPLPNNRFLAKYNSSSNLWLVPDESNGIVPNGRVNALAANDTCLYVGGDFQYVTTPETSKVACWNGSQYAPLASGLEGEVLSLAISEDTLFVGGENLDPTSSDFNAFSISTSTWSSIRNVRGKVYSILPLDNGVVFGGGFKDPGNDNSSVQIYKNGTFSSFIEGIESTIYSLAEKDNSILLGGRFTTKDADESIHGGFVSSAFNVIKESTEQDNTFSLVNINSTNSALFYSDLNTDISLFPFTNSINGSWSQDSIVTNSKATHLDVAVNSSTINPQIVLGWQTDGQLFSMVRNIGVPSSTWMPINLPPGNSAIGNVVLPKSFNLENNDSLEMQWSSLNGTDYRVNSIPLNYSVAVPIPTPTPIPTLVPPTPTPIPNPELIPTFTPVPPVIPVATPTLQPDVNIGTLQINVVDGGGSPFQVLENLSVGIVCSSPNGSRFVRGSVLANTSSLQMQLKEAQYECQASLDGYVSLKGSVYVESNQQSELSLSLLKKKTELNVRIVDAITGFNIEGQIFQINAWARNTTGNFADYLSIRTNNGVGKVAVFSEIPYRFAVRGVNPQNNKIISDGILGRYVIPANFIEADLANLASGEIVIPLSPTDAELAILAKDSSGNPIVNQKFEAYSSELTNFENIETSGNERLWFSGVTDNQGTLKLPLLGERRYTIVPSSESISFQLPAPKEVFVNSGSENRIEYEFLNRNHSVLVRALVPSDIGNAVFKSLSCYLVNDNSETTSSISEGGSEILMTTYLESLDTNSVVSCVASILIGDALWRAEGEANYIPNNLSTGSVEISLALKESLFTGASFDVNSNEDSIVDFPDGKAQLEISSGALSSGETISLNISSDSPVKISNNLFPLSVYDIDVSGSGSQISEIDNSIRLNVKVSKERLRELGVEASDIYPARYDEQNQVWLRSNSYVYDEETETFQATIDHFSIWGILIDLGNKLVKITPTNLKIKKSSSRKERRKAKRLSIKSGKKRRKKTYLLTWDHPQEITPDEYQVTVERLKKLKKKVSLKIVDETMFKVKKAKEYKVNELKLKRKLKKGYYRFSVDSPEVRKSRYLYSRIR